MKRVALVVFPGFQLLDAAATAVFELANLAAPAPLYELSVVSEQGGLVMSSIGVPIQTQAFDGRAYDTLMISGATIVEPSSGRLLELLRAAMPHTRRMASICTGAFVLAEAGLLATRRATTHWHHATDLQRQHPQVRVEMDRIFVRDGNLWTSAGMTACIDLALALVEDDLGREMARSVAKKLVVHQRRAGGQSQFSALAELDARSDRIQNALNYAKDHLRERLSIDKLAEVAHLSPRHFSRAFRAATGHSPAKAVEKLRVETARALVEAGQHSVDRIAVETGFSDAERMRRAFLRAYGEPPQALRRVARARSAAEAEVS